MTLRYFSVGVVLAIASATLADSVVFGADPRAGSSAVGTSGGTDSTLAGQRRLCRELRAAGDRKQALAACKWIVGRGGTAEDFRLAVAALVDMSERPTPEQLLEASTLAAAAVRLAPDQPWGYAARCDIARRWRDPQLISDCLTDLQRVAARHPETERALALSHTRSRAALLLAGWLLVIAAVIVTVIRRYRSWRADRPASRSTVASAVTLGVVAAAWLVATPVQAAPPRQTEAPPEELVLPVLPRIDEANPAASVPTPKERDGDPMKFAYYLQELIDRAQRATERGDHKTAARYYVALATAVPDRSTAFGKLCASLEAAGLRDRALTACGQALEREGVTVEDFTRFVRLTLAKPGRLTEPELKAADSAVKHLQAQKDAALAGNHLACELAVRVEGTERLERCTAALVAAAPKDPKTVYFQWALAVRRKDRDQARALVERARATGMPQAGVTKMAQATDELSTGGWLGLRYWKTGLLLLLLIVGMTITLSRRRSPAVTS